MSRPRTQHKSTTTCLLVMISMNVFPLCDTSKAHGRAPADLAVEWGKLPCGGHLDSVLLGTERKSREGATVGKEEGTGPSVSLHPVPSELSCIPLVPLRQSET